MSASEVGIERRIYIDKGIGYDADEGKDKAPAEERI